jgi:RecA/RadA recombinase
MMFTKFDATDEAAFTAEERNAKELGKYLPFGVKFLDDAMIGVSKGDLVLIGGRSGGGKTELASHIAMTNALQGKKVYFFALEAERNEIADRIKYKILANCYFAQKHSKGSTIAYDRWKAGLLAREFEPYVEAANEHIKKLTNLFVRYGEESYTIDQYDRDILEIKNDADLIIIDHLHYFDLDEAQANAELKAIMKRIKFLALQYQTPVILVAHIRKQDRRFSGLVPDQEDFHGSSDVIKIATKAITIASAYNRRNMRAGPLVDGKATAEEIDLPAGQFASYLKIVKNRRNGSVCMPTALVSYSPDTNSYGSGYILGDEVTEKGGAAFMARESSQIPKWAEGASGY